MKKVWITRTDPGATADVEFLSQRGHHPIKAPLLSIIDGPTESHQLAGSTLMPRPANLVGLVVVTSVHAVAGLVRLGWLEALAQERCIAIGPATAAALAQRGIQAELPALASSEGVLAMPIVQALQPTSVVWLMSGVGGRDLLEQTLGDERGLEVVKFELYERVPLTVDLSLVRQCDAVWFASVAGVEACAKQISGNTEDKVILNQLAVTASPRVAATAEKLGFTSVIVADSPMAQDMYAAQECGS